MSAAGTLSSLRNLIRALHPRDLFVFVALDNAVRHTPEGSEVEIGLSCEKVGGAAQAVIRVRDHGAGVPEEALEKIFRPFYRVKDARDRQTGGAGLGLAIAARAVRVHEGTITAANAPGGDLIVEMRLPVKEPAK